MATTAKKAAPKPKQKVTKADGLVVRRTTFMDLVKSNEQHMIAVLPQHIDPAMMTAMAMQAVTRQPALLEATPTSILQALLTASRLGLSPDGTLGEAYLVPYKVQGGKTVVQFIPGYRGLIKLARNSGLVQRIETGVVYDDDPFDFAFGTEPFITHRHGPAVRNDQSLEGIHHVWACCYYTDGQQQFEVMSIEQIEGIRARAKAQNGPWRTDPVQMARKTVIKRLCNLLPLSAEMSTALRLETEVDENVAQVPDFELKILEVDPEETEEPAPDPDSASEPEDQQPEPDPPATDTAPPEKPADVDPGASGSDPAPSNEAAKEEPFLCVSCEKEGTRFDRAGVPYCDEHFAAANPS